MTSLIGVPFSGASQRALGVAGYGSKCHLPGITVGRSHPTLLSDGQRWLPEWLPRLVPRLPAGLARCSPATTIDSGRPRKPGSLAPAAAMTSHRLARAGRHAAAHRRLIPSPMASVVRGAAEAGPALGRPMVDSIAHSSVRNLKELRPGSAGRTELRIIFAIGMLAAGPSALAGSLA